jgi:hypothetical protein
VDALHADPTASLVDSHEAEDILLSTQDMLAKQNILRDFSVEILYKTCSRAGIDTSTLPLQRGSIYPPAEAMIELLVDHHGVRLAICLI